MIDQNDVTIIIPHLGKTENQQRALDICLKSLRKTVDNIKKIIVVNGVDMDNASEWEHIFRVSESLMAMGMQGQCKAVNAAIATTNTKWIFITNDDMVYPPGWWDQLMLGHYTDLMCLSPKLIEPRPGAPTFETYFCGGAGGDFDKEKWEKFAKEYINLDINRPLFPGFNLPFLIRRDVWDTIQGYDINYDPWGSNSDSDLQAKLHLAGIQPHQNPNCIVYHFGETSGTSHPDKRPYWQKNWEYFISKWGFERASSPDVWFSKNIINYDKLIYKPNWMWRYGEPK